MKRTLVFSLLLASGLALNAAAQTKSSSAAATTVGSPRIAVIAFQTAVTQTNEFQRNFGDLEAKFKPRRQQLKTMSDEIDTLKKQLQAQSSTLSEIERADRTREIDDKTKDLQRAAEDAQNDFQQEMQETFGTVASKIGALLVNYSKEHGYTLVLDYSAQQTAVLYANPTNDITKAIIEAYNLKSGIPAPPARPASSAPGGLPNAPGAK